MTPLGQLRRRNAKDQTEVSTTINGRSASFYSRNRGRNRSSRKPLSPPPFSDTGYTRAMFNSPSRVSCDDARAVVPAPANLYQYGDSSAFSPSRTHLHIILHIPVKCSSPPRLAFQHHHISPPPQP